MRDKAKRHLSDEILGRYLDGDLGRTKRLAARRHLGACPACRARIAEWERLFSRLSGLTRFAPAKGFADRVLARLPAVPAVAPARAAAAPWVHALPNWARRLWPAAAGAAAAWAAAAGGLAVWAAGRAAVPPREWVSWAAGELQEALWTFLVRAAAVLNLPALDVNLGGLFAFVAFLTLLAVWGAQVLYRYATSTTRVRIYA